METHATDLPEGCRKEAYKDNLRIRLYQFARYDGSPTYLVEVAAWNAWAAQEKLISAVGGLDLGPARRLFEDLERDLSHYDWMEGRVVMEGE